jgi:hypothetical protein
MSDLLHEWLTKAKNAIKAMEQLRKLVREKLKLAD